MPAPASEIARVAAAIARAIPLEKLELPEEFFPAHLSVALIDAVFRSRPGRRDDPAASAERYCRHFRIPRTRARRWKTPPVHRQETLGDLIGYFDEIGVDRMKGEVFRARQRLPGTRIARAEYVLHAARALRYLGVDVLQDVPSLPPEDVEDALRPSSEVGDYIVRKLLMYAGDDDYVRGDIHVRRFVGDALGERTVSAARAKNLVRQSAYELILSPRFLYLEIRRHCLAREDHARTQPHGGTLRGGEALHGGRNRDAWGETPARG